jgi:hypothetical protein
MQEAQFPAGKLKIRQDLTPQPTGRRIDVELNIGPFLTLVDRVYRHLAAQFPRFSRFLTNEEFKSMNLSILTKRVSWVRNQVRGIQDGPRVNLTTHVPIDGIVFPAVYSVGRFEAKALGITFVPSMKGLEPYANVDLDLYDRYTEAMYFIKGKRTIALAMPSQPDGTMAFLMQVNIDESRTSASVYGITSEGTSDDALLAATVWQSQAIAAQLYGFTYGVVSQPDQLLLDLVKSATKGAVFESNDYQVTDAPATIVPREGEVRE